jgi:SAM-dependent methyltransferase
MKSTSALHPDTATPESPGLDLTGHRKLWQKLGSDDPFWAVLTDSGKKGNRWDPEEFFRTGQSVVRSLMCRLNKLGTEFPHVRALDFGCGVGRLTQALAEHFSEVIGVDISPAMIERARTLPQRGNGRCEFQVNDRPDLRLFPDGRFDLVFSKIVLQHNEPQVTLAYIREFVRVTRPGGMIVFQLPSCPAPTLIGLLLRVLPIRLIRLIRKMDMYGVSPKIILRVMEEAGAPVIHFERDGAAGKHWIGFQYYARKTAV